MPGSVGKLCWLAVYLCFLSSGLISVLHSLVIPPVAPTGPLQVLTFEESNFIGEKYFQMQISRNDLVLGTLGK